MALARGRVHTNWLRDRLLAEYASGEASPSDIARRIGRPLNLVSYHTKVLLDHGFVELVRTESRRGGIAHIYRASGTPVIDDAAWADVSPQVRRMLVRGVLNAVSDDSREAALAGGFDAATAHISRWPVRLDSEARRDVALLLRRVFYELEAIQAAVNERADPARRRVDVAIFGFVASDS
ncbi:winged helix-turn-helix domain-containing protein [Solirubrobacter phytolaccae]|uniref:Winged helix-turn-helix domain-containing protein n=1 Tax=Solirubrobacter phytolaccae TaxID=1404360 RepID=A0A9X3SE18_9ACTN|nr:winged helix-turn-helix domain-containing protein [Solirubrobacter phytolaccae]MDA0184370.1 winged helix-turn-helix domain-containing protein [Solirubrobacter phytolaccae]